jgi:hypothetical protein
MGTRQASTRGSPHPTLCFVPGHIAGRYAKPTKHGIRRHMPIRSEHRKIRGSKRKVASSIYHVIEHAQVVVSLPSLLG